MLSVQFCLRISSQSGAGVTHFVGQPGSKHYSGSLYKKPTRSSTDFQMIAENELCGKGLIFLKPKANVRS